MPRRRLVALSLLGVSVGAALLAVDAPYPLAVAASLVLGLAAGVPFAVLFAAAQRSRPDAPGAAVAFVNACGILTILVGMPLAGLTFELPSNGQLAFAAIAVLSASSLVVLRWVPP
jgi:predicted MFS family arabinose efflux permease